MRLLFVLTTLLISPPVFSQYFGVFAGPDIRKPAFLSDSVSKGGPSTGITIGMGMIPIETRYKLTLEFSYMLPRNDSMVVETSCSQCYGSYEHYDVAAVKYHSTSFFMNSEYDIEHDLDPDMYFTLGFNSGFVFNSYEFTYDDPIKTLSGTKEFKKTFIYIGPSATVYYDLNNFLLYATGFLDYQVFKDYEYYNYYPNLNFSSRWYFGINAGICLYF